MIEKHYGKANVVADELDSLIGDAAERAAARRDTALQKRNPPGTSGEVRIASEELKSKSPEIIGASMKAGGRVEPATSSLGSEPRVSRMVA
jgi:hypothetical protein